MRRVWKSNVGRIILLPIGWYLNPTIYQYYPRCWRENEQWRWGRNEESPHRLDGRNMARHRDRIDQYHPDPKKLEREFPCLETQVCLSNRKKISRYDMREAIPIC